MALLPPFFLDCVVAIGASDENGQPYWIASGFFYGLRVDSDAEGRGRYQLFLVTNRHVFEGLPSACVRVNPKADEPADVFGIDLQNDLGERLWMSPSQADIDVAVLRINFQMLKDKDMQVAFFRSDDNCANMAKMTELGVCEGDFGYVLGFPMALVGDARNTVIVRNATIARIRDTLQGANKEYLVDSFVFPGNSGGPVVLRPEVASIKGTASVSRAYLIGIVKSYVPYQDVAISQQTKKPRVVFEENSGLAAVHPVDFINEAIATHLAREVEGLAEPKIADPGTEAPPPP